MSDLADALRKLLDKLPQAENEALEAVASTVQEQAIQNYGSYKLARHVVILNGDSLRTVLVNKDYAFYLEEGNNQRGDYIYPKRSKLLRFKINGKTIFAPRVKAYLGKHLFEKSVNEAEPRMQDQIVNIFSRYV